ncbi:Tautomerase enzyme [Rhizobium leguminosarum]|jgi:phenylpyruvate tautomerase PptA (4-oxalocrotonate tautomerase family)|uniref:Tautomerase enzyme n=2 Tax=Rhizobium TaxID=379 RepID=A0A444IE24_RHILE|nr:MULTISPECIES: Tautomerase enzyme [Rhizobium]MBC2807331.1 Tautomerase enzyme [Rhizobium ruizarguesonis]MBY5455751.1 Tautomerase enzyme [Rhizobium leguminosarum]NKJ73587.1 Tautomerase enzyme [Rhizobium leguminosarum bv. viciae]NKL64293.1 Tautomerase enzyme [Rhizobium leguminosarum bv. viciae]NKQ72656.1 Tautomerase enzyme [Rhizobium ruizarguesonis]
MPITLTVPEGLLSQRAQAQAFAGLTEAVLDAAGLTGNDFMTANIIGTINVLPREHVLAAGEPIDAAFVELKLPEMALVSAEAKQSFFEKAADVIEQAAEGRLKREHIWSNIVYAPEGAWGIAGRSYNNADLVGAIRGAVAAS